MRIRYTTGDNTCFKKLNWVAALLFSATVSALPAMAQEFPKNNLLRLSSVNAGGLTDVLARITAEFLQKRVRASRCCGKPPGRSLGDRSRLHREVARDGYTIYLAGAEMSVIPALRNNLPYKFEDFTYLTKFWTTIPMMVVGPTSTFKTPKELIAYMKANRQAQIRHSRCRLTQSCRNRLV